jgi:hypothetical protein
LISRIASVLVTVAETTKEEKNQMINDAAMPNAHQIRKHKTGEGRCITP